MSHRSPARFSLNFLSGTLIAFVLWSTPASGATWTSLDGPLVPVVYPDQGATPGMREVFARAWDQTLWHRVDDRGNWGQWEQLDKQILQSNPAIGQYRTGALRVFARAKAQNASNVVFLSMKDGNVIRPKAGFVPGREKSPWGSLGRPPGAELIGTPTVGVGVENALEIVVRTRAAVWHWSFPAIPGRGGWQSLGLPPQLGSGSSPGMPIVDLPEDSYSMPVAATFRDRRVAVFLRVGDDLWFIAQRAPGDARWTEWKHLKYPAGSGGLSSDPIVDTPVFAASSIRLFVSTRHGIGYLQETDDGRLSDWKLISQPPGGVPIAPPALTYFGSLRSVFINTPDGNAWQITEACIACDQWLDWESLSAPTSAFPRPSASPNLPVIGLMSLRILRDIGAPGQPNVTHLIAGGSDGALWERKRVGLNGAFSPWAPLGRPSPLKAVSRPAVIQEPGGQPVVFVRKEDGAIWYKRRATPSGLSTSILAPSITWSAWKPLGKPSGSALNSDPVVAAGLSNRIELFVWAGDTLWYRTQDTAGGDAWSAWRSMSEFHYSNVPNLGHIGDVAVSSGRLFLLTAYDRTIWSATRSSNGQWDGFNWIVDSQQNQRPPGRHPADPPVYFASVPAATLGLGPFVIGAPGAGSGGSNIWTIEGGQWSDLKKQRGVYTDEIFVGRATTIVPGVNLTDPTGTSRLFTYGRDGVIDVNGGVCGDPQSPGCITLPPPAQPEEWLVTTRDGQGNTALVTGSRDGSANGIRHLFFQGGSTSGWSGWRQFEEFWGIGFGQPALSANANGQVEVYFTDFNANDGNVLFSTAASALRP